MSESKFASLRAVAPDVSRETFERLLIFEATFRDWNSRLNLSSASSLEHLWERHIVDSAQLATITDMQGKWLDIGSGGGFPGVVSAVLMGKGDAPGESGHVHLVESIEKKALFLKVALEATNGCGTVHHLRSEAAAVMGFDPKVVTARAVAPLPNLLGLTFPWLKRGAKGLFHKGRRYKDEIAAARGAWRFDLLEHQSKTDAESVILEISNVSRRL